MDAAYNAAYNQQVRSVNDDFAAKRAANTFSRGLSTRGYARKIGDFQQSFRRSMPQFQSRFAQRGLADSGVYKRALQNHAGDYSRDLSRMYEDQASQGYQFDMNDAQMVAERDRVLADLQAKKQQDIALTAMNIQMLKPFMG